MELLALLNSFSPLGVIALLAYIVYLLVAKNGPVRQIRDNHLHGLPSMEASLQALAQSAERQEKLLSEIAGGMNYLRGRLNGRN